jgi:TusA-related sulfurtransferase
MISFDLRESLIPFSLLKITNAFTKMKPGEVMEIIAGETCICNELQRLLPDSGCCIMADKTVDQCGPGVRVRLTKLKVST